MLFKDRVPDKKDKEALASYLNQEIERHIAYTRVKKGADEAVLKAFDKFETLQEPLFTADRLEIAITDLLTTAKAWSQTLQKEGVCAKKLCIPQVMVITPDTQVVVDTFKALKEQLKSTQKVEIKVQKLFAKHISIDE